MDAHERAVYTRAVMHKPNTRHTQTTLVPTTRWLLGVALGSFVLLSTLKLLTFPDLRWLAVVLLTLYLTYARGLLHMLWRRGHQPGHGLTVLGSRFALISLVGLLSSALGVSGHVLPSGSPLQRGVLPLAILTVVAGAALVLVSVLRPSPSPQRGGEPSTRP